MAAFPNGERRIALYPERLPKDIFKEGSQSKSESQCETDETGSAVAVMLSDISSDTGESPFNIKSKVDTVPRSRRMALSRYGRRQILRAGSCFNSDETTQRLLLTGTLPGTGSKAHRTLAEYSSYASKTLTNWLTRRIPGAKWMYCWEFQKRGALHIHLVIEVPVSVSGYIQIHFKDEWNRILRAICHKSGTDLYAKTANYSHSNSKTQADVTICDREPSRYISKYISKASVSAKSFGRFPPKTWYQISRSLLCVLRDKTEIYEVEGLSNSQALRTWEAIQTLVSRFDIAGARRFDGAVLSCHGYYYDDYFAPIELHKNMMKKGQTGLPVVTVAKIALKTLENYPSARCYTRHVDISGLKEATLNGTASETEMLMLIDTIVDALGATWSSMRKKTQAAMLVKSYTEVRRIRKWNATITDKWEKEINKICEDYLTN